MFENTVNSLIGISRSKPFLLFVTLLLTGFILIHYTASQGQFSMESQQFAPPRMKFSGVSRGILYGQSDNTSGTENTTQSPKSAYIPIESTLHRQCKKKTNVSFLKVHKAGSTTVMNIFLRFAISNQLNIVLPRNSDGFGFNYLGYGKTVTKDNIIPLPNNESYNILCNHVVYNKEAFHSILPNDTFYVGILREPKSHFKSAASYYGFYQQLKKLARTNNVNLRSPIMSEFLKHTDHFRIGTYFVYNRMSFDFGIPKKDFHNDTFVDSYIRELNKDYGLIMIMERFYESLILLKRMLCWDIKDLLYVPLNAMGKKPDFHLTDEDTERLRQWNNADFKLYEHFNRVFSERVAAEGSDFMEEVASFENVQETVKGFCNSGTSSVSVIKLPRTKWDDSFYVTMDDCRLMKENELPMMSRLIKDAWKRYNSSIS